MADYTIGRNDLLSLLTVVLKDADGNAVDLTAATSIRFHMFTSAGVQKIDADAVKNADQVGHKGEVTYTWQAADTDTAGEYNAEWEVTWNTGKPQTFPNTPNKFFIQVTKDLK